MANNKIKGITLEIGGDTTSLSKALGGVNTQARDLQSELKQVERLLKIDPGNTELLAQKQKILAESVENSKSKLDTLKEAEKQVQQQFREGKVGEEQYRLIQREVIATEQNLKKLEKSLAETNRNWKEMGKNLQDVGGKMKDIGGKMTVGVTAPIAAAGAASFKYAADLQDAMGASDQIFKKASGSIKSWADSLESSYGIAEAEALTYANTMGAMLQNIGGLGEEEAAKQAQTLVQLAGDLTAMFGGTTESAVQALTGALKGNNAMLDNYGMGVNDATIKAKAFEMGLIAEGEQLDLASKQAATLALIMEQTADAQGQAAREADGASGSMRSMQTELKNLATDIGEVLLPIITPLIAGLRDLVKRFGEMSPEMQKTIVIVAGLAAAIGPLLMVVGGAISAFGSLTLIAGGLGISVGALVAPIAIAVAAIAGIVTAGILLYKNWDTIKEKAGELLVAISEKFSAMKDAITKPFKDAYENITGTVGKIKEKMSDLNPFKRHSPSLVDQVQSGAKAITDAYNGIKIDNIKLPSASKLGVSGSSTVRHSHSGVIRVEGVNNQGDFMGVVDIIIDKLQMEARMA